MFPLKINNAQSTNLNEETIKKNNAKFGLFAVVLIVIIIFLTPYVINFEWNADSQSPGSNLNEFLSNMDTSKSTPDKNSFPGDSESAFNSKFIDTAIDTPNIPDAANVSQTIDSQIISNSNSDQNGDESTENVRELEKEPINKDADTNLRAREDNLVISKTIYGSKIDQKMGKQSPGKSCVVFYSDDPAVDEEVISTKICPDTKDRHIEFHMKGIFSTHPHASGDSGSEPARVRYIHTGPSVWTSFFNQHDDKHETIVVPPDITTDIQYLTVGHEQDFEKEFDSVRVLHTNTFIFKTRGHQAIFPYCAHLTESKRVEAKTKGFMICRETKKKVVEYTLDKLVKLNVSPQNTDTNGISFISVGNKVELWGYFGKNLDGENIHISSGTSVDLTVALRDKQGPDGKDNNWNKKIKSLKLKYLS